MPYHLVQNVEEAAERGGLEDDELDLEYPIAELCQLVFFGMAAGRQKSPSRLKEICL